MNIMSHQENSAYYRARAAEEVERGEKAATEAAAAVHHEMARRYRALAARSGTGALQLTIVASGEVGTPPEGEAIADTLASVAALASVASREHHGAQAPDGLTLDRVET